LELPENLTFAEWQGIGESLQDDATIFLGRTTARLRRSQPPPTGSTAYRRNRQ
jgi:hypothetical protein